MNGRYILDGHNAVHCADLSTWAAWFETGNRIVAQTDISEHVHVSTVFLGLDHRFGSGPPLLFETMVFRDGTGDDEERYSTWDEAEAGHARTVARERATLAQNQQTGDEPTPVPSRQPDARAGR